MGRTAQWGTWVLLWLLALLTARPCDCHPCGKAVKVRFCCFYCVACPRLNTNVIRELAFSSRDLV